MTEYSLFVYQAKEHGYIADGLTLKRRDDWVTPPAEYEIWNSIYAFQLDAAATAANTKCAHFLGPGSPIAEDALSVSWREVCDFLGIPPVIWLNPEYKISGFEPWIRKCALEALDGCLIASLIPNSRDTVWYHDFVIPAKDQGLALTASRKGRIKFLDPTGAARERPKQGNLVVVWLPEPAKRCEIGGRWKWD